jgi:DNA-binding LacI/PurR family transcriptional regulator
MSGEIRPANLTDVARAAGVSLTTASHSFSGHRPVAASTRERVLRAAAELGFQPSCGTALVAILMRPPEVLPGFAFGTSSFAVLAGSIAVACLRHGLSTVTSTTVDELLGTVRRPDGCVVVTPNYGDSVLAQLVQMDIPTVSFDPDPGLMSFQWWLAVNYEQSAAAMIEHMQAGGSGRICAVVGQTDNVYRRAILAAYRDKTRTQSGGPMIRVIDNALGQRGAQQCIATLLSSPRRPDAVLTSSSVFARGALTAALAAGLAVPQEFRVGTCTDGPAAEFAPVPISALRIDANTTADSLVSLLLARMDDQALPTADRQVIQQQLVRRSST